MKDIATLHELIETESRQLSHYSDYSSIIKKFLGAPNEVDRDILLKGRAENDSLNFTLNQNGLVPHFTGTDKDGLPYHIPDINEFSIEQLDYLVLRQEKCQSPFLRARYCHVLWLSKKKRIEHAKTAIEAYIELTDLYLLKEKEVNESHHVLAVNCLKVALNLAFSIKYERDKIKNKVIDVLGNINPNVKSSAGFSMNLVRFMISKKGVFKKDDFEGVVEKIDSIKKTVEEKNNHVLENLVELIIKIERKRGRDLTSWYRELGAILEAETRGRKDGSFVTTDFCRKAISAYRKSGNNEKVKELSKLYGQLKKDIELDSVGHDINITDLVFEAKKWAKALSKNKVEDILKVLANDARMIPSRKKLEQRSREVSQNSFLRMINSSVIDGRGHTVKHYTTNEEKDFEELMFHYNHELQLWHFHLLREILYESIFSGKLNYASVLNYLSKESWYGQELEFASRMDVNIAGKWLAQLAPSIVEFFFALDQLLYSNKTSFTIVACFDSLTVKIEGLLRALAEYSQIDTYVTKKDKSGRDVSEEIDIMRLLTEPDLVALIGEDDILFLRFLFTERSGLNLRNKVAHGLMKFDNYSLSTLMFIFLAIMRLSRFSLKRENETKNEHYN